LPAGTALKLTPFELNRAFALVERSGGSDFFPAPFEIRALRAAWPSVRAVLASTDLRAYVPAPFVSLMAPKHNYTVRVALLPDPIDLIIFTAVVLRLAKPIQRRRDRYQEQRVFSYRFSARRPRAVGGPVYSDYPAFLRVAQRKAARATAVGAADIADFFPRVYLHRLENSLVALSGDGPATQVLMGMLTRWSGGTSYGIPVGLRASNLIAEALLVEVDEFLLSRGIDFIRYVDDYTFFGASEADCSRALYHLGSRLADTQGLSLNDSKTRVYSPQQFMARLNAPQTVQRRSRADLLRTIQRGDPYAEIDEQTLTPVQRRVIRNINAKKLLEDALDQEPADLSTIRFVLKFLSSLRRPELVSPVLENLDRLLPVSESVARFLDVFDNLPPERVQEIAGELVRFIGRAFVPDFQLIWLLEPFSHSSAWNHLDAMRALATDHAHPMVRRQAILALGAAGDRSALLDIKSRWHGASPWEARSILFACRGLPKDERDALYRLARPRGQSVADALLRAVLDHARTA
jgi:hypothetical protein